MKAKHHALFCINVPLRVTGSGILEDPYEPGERTIRRMSSYDITAGNRRRMRNPFPGRSSKFY